jgi:hypothetical protein
MADLGRRERQRIIRVQPPDEIGALRGEEPLREQNGVRRGQRLIRYPAAVRGLRRGHVAVQQAIQLVLEAQRQDGALPVGEREALGAGAHPAIAVRLPDLRPLGRLEKRRVLARSPGAPPLVEARRGLFADAERHETSSPSNVSSHPPDRAAENVRRGVSRPLTLAAALRGLADRAVMPPSAPPRAASSDAVWHTQRQPRARARAARRPCGPRRGRLGAPRSHDAAMRGFGRDCEARPRV